MYRIIGADDKEYGPVPAEQIRQWLREGRLNRLTRVKPEGAPDWKVIGALAEFADQFPPLPGAAPRPTGPTQTCGMARASLICGALGFTCVTAVLGLVLGFRALDRIRKSNGQLTGAGMATTGIVLSLIFMLLGLLAVPTALLLPALAKAKQRAQSINCINKVKQLELAVLMYSNDNKDVWPSATTWCDDILQYVGSPQVFKCPTGDARQRGHYALNAKLAGLPGKGITNPAKTVMIFESDQGWNASGGPELMLQAPRHRKAVVIGFADGDVELVTEARLSQLNWEP